MLGLAAAPEIVMAVPRVKGVLIFFILGRLPYSDDNRYTRRLLPVWRRVEVNDSALRCCHARFLPETRFSVAFTTCRGAKGSSEHIGRLSCSSNPVNQCGSRLGFDAPR